MPSDDRFPVFISWSGKRAQTVARALKDTIATALQATSPFFSSDIEAGRAWGPAIQEALTQADYGIVVVTPENQGETWLNFEAGAISKMPESRVSTLLVGLSKTDLRPPLSLFQASEGSRRDDIEKIFRQINARVSERGGASLEEAPLQKQFDAFLPSVVMTIEKAAASEQDVPERSRDDMTVEVLSNTRLMLKQIQRISSHVRSNDTPTDHGASKRPLSQAEVEKVYQARFLVESALKDDAGLQEFVLEMPVLPPSEIIRLHNVALALAASLDEGSPELERHAQLIRFLRGMIGPKESTVLDFR